MNLIGLFWLWFYHFSYFIVSHKNLIKTYLFESSREKSQRKIVPTEKARKICEFCQKVFEGGNRSRDYEVHVRRCKKFHKFVVGENSTQCSLCPGEKEFANQGTLYIHFEKMHSNEECEVCEDTILKKHWTNHWKHCQKYKGNLSKIPRRVLG